MISPFGWRERIVACALSAALEMSAAHQHVAGRIRNVDGDTSQRYGFRATGTLTRHRARHKVDACWKLFSDN